jgi:TonB-linked SusC/RagA family outer membrane protein
MQKTGNRYLAANRGRQSLHGIFPYTRFAILCFAITLMTAFSSVSAQSVTLSAKNMPLKEVFSSIKQQTGYTFFGRNELFKTGKPVTLSVQNMPLTQALDMVLREQPIQYRINGTQIILSHKENSIPQAPAQLNAGTIAAEVFPVTGMIYNSDGMPLPGATVTLKGTKLSTVSNMKGEFVINASRGDILLISFVGYTTAQVTVASAATVNVTLNLDDKHMNDVVVTGIVNRKAETFSGASVKITKEELLKSGGVNVFQSLKNIEPSLKITDDFKNGSNPNVMPSMQIRGTSSFPNTGQYTSDPNLPLFIVDGFESTVQKVNDLDMNRIESVTILKDAASKAIYGSRAANGVVVIETIKVTPGDLRVDYTGTLNIESPDLSSYNLTNSTEKLQLEQMLGAYAPTSGVPAYGLSKDSLYYANLKAIQSGVNTNWLAQPVRTGIGYRHSVNMEVGTKALTAGASLFVNDMAGAMKGSDRNSYGGSINLMYRTSKVFFRNLFQYTVTKSTESPYGDFSQYALLNPYWTPKNPDGTVSQLLGLGPVYSAPVYNPLYNVPYYTNSSQYNNVTNNTYLEYTFNPHLKLNGRLGLSKDVSGSDVFYSSKNTRFINYADSLFFQKGSYDKGNGVASTVSSDLYLNYNKSFGKHHIFANAGGLIRQDKSENYTYSAVGFPNDRMDNIMFANQYDPNKKPSGSQSINREIGFLGIGNYSYADKYFVDLTLRRNASSQFGSKNRWGTFWSVGGGWNIHKEAFFSGLSSVFKQFKLRSSIGYTGSQNFSSDQSMLLYQYFTNASYQNMVGATLNGLANSSLKWQQKYEFNVGLDMNILDKIVARVDFYRATTENLITPVSTPPSLGFPSYTDNLGQMLNTGYEFKVVYNCFVNPRNNSSLSLFVNGTSNINSIQKISNSLQSYNQLMSDSSKKTNKPLVQFQEGQPMDAIWAVKSMGIDPATGQEIYVKKNGKVTNVWDPTDEVVVGAPDPKLYGNFGANYSYKGFSTGITFRYTIGGQLYNQTLVDKVENASVNNNVDKRAFYDSWKKPGDVALYRSIGLYSTTTYATSRFVQNQNDLNISSIYLSYDFYKSAFLQKMKMKKLRVMLNMNDVTQFSSIRIERGTSYPFAHTYSFSVFANF